MTKNTPQLDDGYTRIANELLEALLAVGLTSRQWAVTMAIIRKTYGFNKKADDISASQIGEICAMQRPHVSETLGQLAAMKIIFKEPGRFGTLLEINKNYLDWIEIDAKGAPKERPDSAKKEHAFHYTYRTTRTATGEFYLGVRSCSCHPNQDRYIGSGNWIATVRKAELVKEVIDTYASRGEAEQAEKGLIRTHSADPLNRNTALYASTDSVQGEQVLYGSTDSVQGVQKSYAPSTDSVQIASTESVHTKDNLPKDNPKRKTTTEFPMPEWLSLKAWTAYLDMRKRIKKPMTDYAMDLAVKELGKLKDAGQDPEAVLNQSTMNSWQGLFEVKAKNGKPGIDRHGSFGQQDYRAGVAADGSF